MRATRKLAMANDFALFVRQRNAHFLFCAQHNCLSKKARSRSAHTNCSTHHSSHSRNAYHTIPHLICVCVVRNVKRRCKPWGFTRNTRKHAHIHTTSSYAITRRSREITNALLLPQACNEWSHALKHTHIETHATYVYRGSCELSLIDSPHATFHAALPDLFGVNQNESIKHP